MRLRQESSDLQLLRAEERGASNSDSGPIGANTVDSQLSEEVLRPASLHGDLAELRAREASLTSDNGNLRSQLRRWQSGMAPAVQTEAGATKPSRTGAEVSPLGGVKKEATSLLASTVKTYVFNSGKEPLDNRANAIRILILFMCINGVFFLTWRSWEGQRAPLTKFQSRVRHMESSALRLLGRGRYEVEVSELQVANLPGGSDVFLCLQFGDSQQRTGILKRPPAVVLRFQERLRLQVSAPGSESETCKFCIKNARSPHQDEVASFELSTKDLLRRLHSKHGQQYFSFNLQLQEPPAFDNAAVMQPKLSLRLREAKDLEPRERRR